MTTNAEQKTKSLEKLGPQGGRGKPDTHKKRPQKEGEQVAKSGDFDGQVA